jgi:NAD(P)-dependent dehydrogenase (short-subunit alcohol dehydrogenase family)
LGILAEPSSVVMSASIAVTPGLLNMSIYPATKAAVISPGKTLAVELGGRRIQVNTICPGPIATPAFKMLGLPGEGQRGIWEQFASQFVLKRMGKSNEVSKLVRFPVSQKSCFIAGDGVTIDRGIRLN